MARRYRVVRKGLADYYPQVKLHIFGRWWYIARQGCPVFGLYRSDVRPTSRGEAIQVIKDYSKWNKNPKINLKLKINP